MTGTTENLHLHTVEHSRAALKLDAVAAPCFLSVVLAPPALLVFPAAAGKTHTHPSPPRELLYDAASVLTAAGLPARLPAGGSLPSSGPAEAAATAAFKETSSPPVNQSDRCCTLYDFLQAPLLSRQAWREQNPTTLVCVV